MTAAGVQCGSIGRWFEGLCRIRHPKVQTAAIMFFDSSSHLPPGGSAEPQDDFRETSHVVDVGLLRLSLAWHQRSSRDGETHPRVEDIARFGLIV